MALTVSSLSIYPIKSCGGIGVDAATVQQRGFEHDRRWMLIDSDLRFISQREVPVMATFRLSLGSDHCAVRGRDGSTLDVPFSPPSPKQVTVTIWDDVVRAHRVSDEMDEWFSRQLGTSCMLVEMPGNSHRQANLTYARPGDIVSFADAYPVLIAAESSLEDLNRRMEHPVPMNRFRPNIVIRGSEPFAEDQWSAITLPHASFRIVKGCARCVVTTIDQETGVAGSDPLVTLATFRKRQNKVYFGQNAVPLVCGPVRVGESLVPTAQS